VVLALAKAVGVPVEKLLQGIAADQAGAGGKPPHGPRPRGRKGK
jgi:hypothetical protein